MLERKFDSTFLTDFAALPVHLGESDGSVLLDPVRLIQFPLEPLTNPPQMTTVGGRLHESRTPRGTLFRVATIVLFELLELITASKLDEVVARIDALVDGFRQSHGLEKFDLIFVRSSNPAIAGCHCENRRKIQRKRDLPCSTHSSRVHCKPTTAIIIC